MDKIFTDVGVRSIASALPKNVLDLKTLGSVFGDETVEKIIASTGISEVRIAAPDKTTSGLLRCRRRRTFCGRQRRARRH